MSRTVEVCTTYNKEYYDLCAKNMIESFVKYWPKYCILHAYWQEQEPEIIQDNIDVTLRDDLEVLVMDEDLIRKIKEGLKQHNPKSIEIKITRRINVCNFSIS